MNRFIVTSTPSEVEVQGTRGRIERDEKDERDERGERGERDEANDKKRARASDQKRNLGHEDVAELIEMKSEASETENY